MERIERFNAVCDFPWQKSALLAKAGTLIYISIHSTKWAEKDFGLYVEGASSGRIKQDGTMLKLSVFTIGRNLQFFNCPKFVMFSDRH